MLYPQIVEEVNKKEPQFNPETICRQTRRMKKKGMVEGNGERGFRLALSKKKYRTLDTLAKR